jgi:hypothetical protein
MGRRLLDRDRRRSGAGLSTRYARYGRSIPLRRSSIPIVMVVLSLTVPYPAIRWISIVVSALAVVFNLAGLPYAGWYDSFLIGVSFVFNALIVWYAWTWHTVA